MPVLDGLAATVGSALSGVFFDAILIRAVPGTPDPDEPWKPTAPTTQQYACKAMVEQFSAGFLANGLVNAGEVKVLVLVSTLSVDPVSADRIKLTTGPYADRTFTIVPPGGGLDAVRTDPAKAVWECRAA